MAEMENSSGDLIDSGGSHHYLHSKNFFMEYIQMKKDFFKFNSGQYLFVGKGAVYFKIGSGTVSRAYCTNVHDKHYIGWEIER